MLELVPPRVRPDLLEAVFLQQRGHDGGQRAGVRLVGGAAREDDGLGVVVHGVGVLGGDGVEEPRAGRLDRVVAARAAAAAQILPVAQAVPLLVGDDARFQRALAVLVAAQQLHAARHVLVRDGGQDGGFDLGFVHVVISFRVEAGAFRSVSALWRKLHIHFPASPYRITPTSLGRDARGRESSTSISPFFLTKSETMFRIGKEEDAPVHPGTGHHCDYVT